MEGRSADRNHIQLHSVLVRREIVEPGTHRHRPDVASAPFVLGAVLQVDDGLLLVGDFCFSRYLFALHPCAAN